VAATTECSLGGAAGICGDSGCNIDVCAAQLDGEACTDIYEQIGLCAGGYCAISACSNLSEGDVCYTSDQFLPGECVAAGADGLTCAEPCSGKPAGSDCSITGLSGICGEFGCDTNPCNADNVGSECTSIDGEGTCQGEEGGYWCLVDGGGSGGVDGLGVDACGNVYATEYIAGVVWRITPDGDLEKFVNLPSSWIPNVKWGRGEGGFSQDVLYVTDRDEGRLFAVSVGVPGAAEYYEVAP
jgi:hypothetical protein